MRWAIVFVALFLADCGDSNRYEISKDGAGRTARLDKKTGEIAVIVDSQIQILKDPKELAREQEKHKELAKPKEWDGVDNQNLNVRFNLKTVWRDGKMFYNFQFYHLGHRSALVEYWLVKADDKKTKDEKKKALAAFTKERVSSDLAKASRHAPFIIQLYDDNGTRLQEIVVSKLTRIVDDNGFVNSYQNESSIQLSAELYTQLKTFSVGWSNR